VGLTIFVWKPELEWKGIWEKREEKPVSLNSLAAVKTKKFKYREQHKGCLLVFIQNCTPQRFPAQFSNKKAFTRTVIFGVHFLMNIMECV